MLCYDLMEPVGQEVSRCRDVHMNIAKYDSVVSSMRDMCWEAYDYEYHDDDYEPDDELSLDDYYEESYGSSFISDFKNCIYEYCAVPQELRSNLDVCGKWSRGWVQAGPVTEMLV